MPTDHVISPEAFARLSAYLGHPTADLARTLARSFALTPANATALALKARRERTDIDAREERDEREERELDQLAVDSERG